MPVAMTGERIPTLWAGKKRCRSASVGNHDSPSAGIDVALINNMPDSALEDTEMQFFELLDAASGDIPVRVKLYSLPNVPRGDRGQEHLTSFYSDINDLLSSRFDGVVITGTEPRQPNLQDEPYWPIFTDVLDWAERNTTSTVLSCLAAHASVLHSDGIQRHPLDDKQFGVFDYKKVSDHALTSRSAELVRFPHSRWNEVREDALTSCGYTVLTSSTEAGVDSFVKKKGRSLFVHFQGHPEYGAQTLLKEYRRDVKRFLRRERETYPSMPRGYFDAEATKLLATFQESTLSDPREDYLTAFPDSIIVGAVQNTWHSSAICVYRNWLQYVLSKKSDASTFPVMARIGRTRSTLTNNGIG